MASAPVAYVAEEVHTKLVIVTENKLLSLG